jgi:hypothetical protein
MRTSAIAVDVNGSEIREIRFSAIRIEWMSIGVLDEATVARFNWYVNHSVLVGIWVATSVAPHAVRSPWRAAGLPSMMTFGSPVTMTVVPP